jgi:hypothetical protein
LWLPASIKLVQGDCPEKNAEEKQRELTGLSFGPLFPGDPSKGRAHVEERGRALVLTVNIYGSAAMISPVLLKVTAGFGDCQSGRVAPIQHSEELLMFVSDELQQARC